MIVATGRFTTATRVRPQEASTPISGTPIRRPAGMTTIRPGIVAAADDVLPGRNRLIDLQLSVSGSTGIFLHDHRIGASGQHSAGRHPDRLSGLNPQGGLASHSDLANQFKTCRHIGGCRRSFAGNQA
jgi:hypothetical protein